MSLLLAAAAALAALAACTATSGEPGPSTGRAATATVTATAAPGPNAARGSTAALDRAGVPSASSSSRASTASPDALGSGPALAALTPAERRARAAADLRRLAAYGRAADALVVAIAAEPALSAHKPQLSADERRRALELFAQVYVHAVALDRMADFHFDFWRLDLVRDAAGHVRHFALGFAAYVEMLRLAYAFVTPTLKRPVFERLLDEGAPELDLPRGAYARMKWNVVHVADVGQLFAAQQYHNFLALTLYSKLLRQEGALLARLDDQSRQLSRWVARESGKLLLENGLDILEDKGHQGWFPIQADVAEFLGDTRVRRLHASLISDEQIAEAVHWSRPGDVIVERRNWYLSNVGLPGFWPHAALYLGSPSELAAFLDGDAEVVAAYGGGFTRSLARSHPAAWKAYSTSEEGTPAHPMRLIEAISEGVVFTSAEHSFAADYAAALRPRLSKLEIARAIERAFSYHLRPYDFDFDFATDRSLVCSELVFKAYEPQSGVRGLRWSLTPVLGRQTLPPNAMIAQLDAEHGKPGQQLDVVWFLDGREKTRSAEWSTAELLRASHQRPKWDVAQE